MILIYLFLLYLFIFIVFPYRTLQITLRLIGNIIFNKKTIGYNIPKKGGALLISNHVSHIDFMLIALATKRKVHFVMYDTIYYHKAIHWLLKRLNMIPIAPRAMKNNLDDFNQRCAKIINNGGIVAIYPEGTVSRNGHILKFKKGMEHIAKNLNAPIIPMHLYGVNGSPFTYSVEEGKFNSFSLFRLRKKIYINIGKPLPKNTSSFIARQKVLELEAESAYYFHSNKKNNLAKLIFNQANSSSLFLDNNNKVTPNDLKKDVLNLTLFYKEKLKNKETVILTVSDELLFVKSVLALSILGKTIVVVSPQESNNNALLIKQKSNTDTYITDHNLFTLHSSKRINISGINDKLNFTFLTFLSTLKFRFSPKTDSSILFPNFKQSEVILDHLSLTNTNAFIQSVSSTHKINSYGKVLNLKDIYSPIGFLTKVALPMTVNLKLFLNTFQKENLLLQQADTLIGEKQQIEKLFNLAKKENWQTIKTIIVDGELETNCQAFFKEQKIQIYKASGIEGIVGLLSINTPNYKGIDIAGHTLIQDGNSPDTCGRPIQGLALKIVNPNDYSKTLEAEELGTVLIKGALVMQSFKTSPLAWVDSRLTGSIDENGYLTLKENNQI